MYAGRPWKIRWKQRLPRLRRAVNLHSAREFLISPLISMSSIVKRRFVDVDEGFQEWRYRHVKMVERTIGTKRGSGGSAGVEYLRSTLFQPVFPDLWEIRGRL